MANANELKAKAAKLAAALPAVERVDAIDARLAAIETERRALVGLLPKAEAAERIAGWLRASRESFERDGGLYRLSALDAVMQVSAEPSIAGMPSVPQIRDWRHAFDVVLWLLGPRLEECVADAVGRLTYVEGAPSEERRTRRAALDEERAQLVAEREDLVETAQAASVALEHLPETRQRREAEAARAQNEAAARRRQEEVARAVDARHEAEVEAAKKTGRVVIDPDARPTAARSEYLSRG